jgi:hypothetical protein
MKIELKIKAKAAEILSKGGDCISTISQVSPLKDH